MDVGGAGLGGQVELSHTRRHPAYHWSACEESGGPFYCHSQHISPECHNVVRRNYSNIIILGFQILTTLQSCELEQDTLPL